MKIYQHMDHSKPIDQLGCFSVVYCGRYHLVTEIDGNFIELGQCNDYEKTYKKGIDQWLSKVYSRCVDTESSYRWQADNLIKQADGEREIIELIKSMRK
ncbi:hypothetical protein ASwh1_136 [Aeromonas phage Aswh_1]|nr:hypothetical protein ASwh1_136 [Aeromonas phage Aswh_1]